MSVLDDHSFALLLTHDIDRVHKTYQAVYYAVTRRDVGSLVDLLPWRHPYWQFKTIMDIEDAAGVRSSFNFLNERSLVEMPPTSWVDPQSWRLYAGRYDIQDHAIRDVIRDLDTGGWEIGLHGSYTSYDDPERLRMEKTTLESIVGHQVVGGRQHYLNLSEPETWRHQSATGLRYDSSLGSSTTYGFDGRYAPFRPFDDEFVVFPLTLMEKALPSVETDPERAWEAAEQLLRKARDNGAVMTVLWHLCYFHDTDHPNYRALYRRLIDRALELGAWAGSPGTFYESMDHPVASTRMTKDEHTDYEVA